jgi:hypothetical protein
MNHHQVMQQVQNKVMLLSIMLQVTMIINMEDKMNQLEHSKEVQCKLLDMICYLLLYLIHNLKEIEKCFEKRQHSKQT